MPQPDEAASKARPARGDQSVEARRAARQEKAKREMRIIGLLTSGVSIVEIAAREGVTLRRMRAVVQEILARRRPDGPRSEFLALQIGRLNEALIVSYGAMSGGNLQAVDRVVKIVRELDRYHGFAAVPHPPAVEPHRLSAPAQAPLALTAQLAGSAGKLEMAPQAIEKAQSAAENGAPRPGPLPQAGEEESGALSGSEPIIRKPYEAPGKASTACHRHKGAATLAARSAL